jgi:hypothetical protein
MHIKTVRWKKKRAGILLRYIESDKGRGPAEDSFVIYHNIPVTTLEGSIRAFDENDSFRKARRNGVRYYHEVLSFHPKDRDLVTPEILENIARKYIEIRCPRALVYARPHLHEAHPHIHFAISGTEYRNRKTLRMDDATFERLRYGIENYQVSRYPQLKHSIVYLSREKRRGKDRQKEDRNTRKEREKQMNQRGLGKDGEKQQAITEVRTCLLESQSFLDFENRLQHAGLALYKYRGKTTGIVFGKRKYRFKTLGMSKEIIRELEKDKTNRERYQTRIQQLQILQESKPIDKNRSR